MSLRLPSQNKFKPVARPAVRKGPSAHRPASTPTTSSTISLKSTQPAASQSTAPVTFATLSSSASTALAAQIPPSLGSSHPPSLSPASISTPIASAQVREIRNKQYEANGNVSSVIATRAPDVATESSNTFTTAPDASPTQPRVRPSGPSTYPLVPRSTPAPPGAKLSLLDAARAHTSAGPSPGGIARRTPSISSQARRAPSVTPQFEDPHPVTSRQLARTPSATPQPEKQPSYGVPPSLATSAPASGIGFGLPPSLGVSNVASSSRHSTPPANASELAAAVVSTILPPVDDAGYPRVELGKPQKRSRKPRYPRPAPEPGSVQEEGSAPGSAGHSQWTTQKPARRNKAAPVEEREPSQDTDISGESGTGEGDERRAKRKEAADTTPVTSRPVKKTRNNKPKPITVSQVSLVDVRPNEMVGDRVDEGMTTMGDLATVLAAQGKVSKRAIKIDEFKRNEEMKRRAAAQARALETWRRNQIKRRKVRAAKNEERVRRREELGKLGMDEGQVSPDEDDSEEEYEPIPDRLTPESTPEPQLRLDPEMPEREDDDDEPRTVDGDRDDSDVDTTRDEILEDGSQAGDEVANNNDNFDATVAPEEEDEETAALRAAGFMVTADAGDGDLQGDGDGDDEDFDEQPWLQGDEPDLDGYRYELEERRRRMIQVHEDDGEVVEVDDETRFINSATFGKNSKPQRWTAQDTELFYLALEETGENYSLMAAYFPGRTNRQLKLKGLRENKLNPARMTAAILSRKPLDKAYLSKSAGYDPDKPWDREEALFEEARQDQQKLRTVQSDGLGLEEGVREEQEGDDGMMDEADEKSGDEGEKEDDEDEA
ncbi:hypothetical protein IAR55_001712 [Kwoniella newhampshirensis]|uniref:Myb-like domain-containing protein n=1 Tax=Kwoniella newhampshirensis TaxID=1651941 RepID=A0AAW0Z2Y3_9TREE